MVRFRFRDNQPTKQEQASTPNANKLPESIILVLPRPVGLSLQRGCGSMRDSSTAASSSCTAADSKPLIESWLRSVGIWWDEGLVQIRSGCSGCSGPNLGVFAVTDIIENQVGYNQHLSAVLLSPGTPAARLVDHSTLQQKICA